jgi:2-dehydropantoate 2-reductase
MKTLIIGAGPLGSLYTYLLHRAGHDVTLLARNDHYEFLLTHGLVLVNEYTEERMVEHVKVVDTLSDHDEYDLAIILMRKNSLRILLPMLGKNKKIKNFLFMGNNGSGFEEYLDYLPSEKVLFGFPGGGGSNIDHITHYVDSENPNGKRMAVTLGEIDGKTRERTRKVQQLFESSGVPVKLVDDIDSWLKYHIAFVLPVAGALLTSGDNYQLAKDKPTIRKYILAVREAGRVLKSLGYTKSYNSKFKLFYWMPLGLLTRILSKVFNSKFSEVAMMMHVHAAKDEMIELAEAFYALKNQSGLNTPNLDELMRTFIAPIVEELQRYGAPLEMPAEAIKEQSKIMMRALRKQFGFRGMIGVFLDMFFIQIKLKKDHPVARQKALSISKSIEKELFTFSALYLALSKRLGRNEAYTFFKIKVMNEIARTSMPIIYQVKDLKRCEGDVFENFKKMNIALFERTTKDGTWLMENYQDEQDKLTVKITTCANVELFKELNVPELGKFGCDHDLAGYAIIEKEVDCEFRRLCTIANGDDHCLFEFYRKGTAPDNAHLNV